MTVARGPPKAGFVANGEFRRKALHPGWGRAMQRLRVPILFVVSNLSKKALIAKKGVGTGRSGRESASGFSLLSVWAYLFAAMKINSLVRKAATSRGHLFRLDVVAPGPQLSRSGTRSEER